MCSGKNKTKRLFFTFQRIAVFFIPGILIIVLFFLQNVSLFAQSLKEKKDPFTDHLKELHNDKNIDGIYTYIDSLIIDSKKDDNRKNVVKYLGWKASYANTYDKIIDNYTFLSEAKKVLIDNKISFGKFYYDKFDKVQVSFGNYYYKRGDWQKAEEIFKTLLIKYEQKPDKDSIELARFARIYRFLGAIHKEKGNIHDAQTFISKSHAIENKITKTSSGNKGLNYRWFGELYYKNNDNVKALFYYRKAKEIFEKEDMSNNRNVTRLTATLLHMADMYSQQNLPDSAAIIMQKVEKIRKKYPLNNKENEFFQTYGNIFLRQKQYDKALGYYEQCYQLRNTCFGNNHFKVAEVLNNIGQVYNQQNKFKSAIKYYNDALTSLFKSDEPFNNNKNPISIQNTLHEITLLKTLHNKAKALNKIYLRTKERATLNAAMQTIELAVSLVDNLKTGYSSDDDKLVLLDIAFPIYETALAIISQYDDEKYDEAFEIIEKSKAVLLFETLRKNKALQFAGLPENLLENEKQLKYELSILKDSINQYQNNIDKTGSFRIAFDKKKLEYDKLITLLENDYPDYYKIKYSNQTITLEETQNQLLDKTKTLIEYFVGEENIYIFSISKNNVKLNKIKLDFPLKEWVSQFTSSIYSYYISPKKTEELYRQTTAKYKELAFKIYEKIIKPIENNLSTKLIIIPDGVLGYIPFDALLTSLPTEVTKISKCDFLWQKHQISYAYSANLLSEAITKKNAPKYKNPGILAFAPGFHKLSIDPASPIDKIRNQIDTLFFNEREAQNICNYFRGSKIMVMDKATKENFLNLASDYQVVHIASHGILNENSSDYSYIAFSNNCKDLEKNRLFVHELYSRRFNAELVTLSACQTGIGELKRGEGIISMARGFSGSGIKSLVTTLWSVNDLSTTRIMELFYKNLKEGLPKDEALYRAKKEFLDNQKEDYYFHPFFWAAYIPIGNMEPIHTSTWNYWYFIVIGLVLTAIVAYFAKK